jgi:hypothetical protein
VSLFLAPGRTRARALYTIRAFGTSSKTFRGGQDVICHDHEWSVFNFPSGSGRRSKCFLRSERRAGRPAYKDRRFVEAVLWWRARLSAQARAELRQFVYGTRTTRSEK